MEFEFDPEKSAANLAKHGIDFATAQTLWDDAKRLVTKAKSIDEERFAVIGSIEGKLWTAFVTYREAATRIISLRRSRDGEAKAYDTQGNNSG